MALTGEPISAEEAMEAGLVHIGVISGRDRERKKEVPAAVST